MQRNKSSFNVTRAKLSVSERVLMVIYTEAFDDRPLSTELQASAFEHYLKCLHDVECPSLVEWMLQASPGEIHERIAAFMDCMMWSAYEEATGRPDERREGQGRQSIARPLPIYPSFLRA